jgi:hypothetical protein
MRGDVVQRLRQPEQDNERLKGALADAAGQPDPEGAELKENGWDTAESRNSSL